MVLFSRLTKPHDWLIVEFVLHVLVLPYSSIGTGTLHLPLVQVLVLVVYFTCYCTLVEEIRINFVQYRSRLLVPGTCTVLFAFVRTA